MTEPFKNLLNKNIIEGMAVHLKKHWPDFDDKGFVSQATYKLDSLELKARSEQITQSLITYLPDDFNQAGKVLLACLGTPLGDEGISTATVDDNGIAGWAINTLAHYVGLQGQDHFDLSMRLFKEMTKRETAEFGVRFFLLKAPKKTLDVMKNWTSDKDRHVRRLASEGCRPRLPWSMQLPDFIQDPEPVIEILECLKSDKEDYVRRSVANNLNDIAKDHPDRVAEIAKQWLVETSKERQKLVRHACRTLIKQGHKKTLTVLGYKEPKLKKCRLEIATPKVKFGNALQFTFSTQSDSNTDQLLMIDYIIHHQKANGKTSPKVFKWKNTNLKVNDALEASRKHAIKKITTRVYYPGLHSVEIIVNGISMAKSDFRLVM